MAFPSINVIRPIVGRVRLTSGVRGNVVGLLRRECTGIVLRHIAQNKGSHLPHLIHAGPVVVRGGAPQSRENPRDACSVFTMASRASLLVNRFASGGIAFQGRHAGQSTGGGLIPGRCLLREPVQIGKQRGHLTTIVRQRRTIFTARNAFLNAILERNITLGSVAEHRKPLGGPYERNPIAHRSALEMAIAATELIANVSRGVLGSLRENVHAEQNAFAGGSRGDFAGIRRRPCPQNGKARWWRSRRLFLGLRRDQGDIPSSPLNGQSKKGR